MADPNFFPGFEGDDEPKKPAPAAKPAAAPAKPAFDPFAEAPVAVPGAAAPPPPPPPAAAGAKPVRPAPAAAPPPPPPPPPADADADLKPGSRKDLWKCPHCGAGNKPDRTTCRSCGKSPDEPVMVPWHQNNLIRAGIIAAVGLVVILIVILGKVDLTLRPAELARVDAKPRIGEVAQGTVELAGGVRFEAEKQISVCGRVAAVKSGPAGTQLIALALGSAAQTDAPEVSEAGKGYDIPGGVVLACSADTPLAVKPGQILSLKGATGVLIKESSMITEPSGMIPVRVEESQVGE
jgi:hypothetical protein